MDLATTSPPRSPRKRLRMDNGAAMDVEEVPNSDGQEAAVKNMPVITKQSEKSQLDKESAVGILHYVSNVSGFEGLLKKRYTDFLVNEILPDGTVVHLDSVWPSKTKPQKQQHQSAVAPKEGSAKAAETKPGPKLGQADPSKSAEQPVEVEVKVQPAAEPEAVLKPDQTKDSEPVKQAAEGEAHVALPEEAEAVPAPDQSEHFQPAKQAAEDEATTAPPTNAVVGASTSTGARGESSANDAGVGAGAWRDYAEKHPGFTLSADNRSTLEGFLGPSETNEVLGLYNRILESPHRKPFQYGDVRSTQTIDRAARTDLHQAIRHIFASRLESRTEHDGTFVITAASATTRPGPQHHGKQGQGRGRGPMKGPQQKFAELGGDFIHFSLYKENKDTMEVISFIARMLNTQPKAFQFAGTKDRRAITVQRVSAYRVTANALAGLNAKLRNAKVGNFSYERKSTSLGDLTGNEFVITLRDCVFPLIETLSGNEKVKAANDIAQTTMKHLAENGFINYYGMQRFGTFATRTDTIGTKLLQRDYEGAVNILLEYNPDALEAFKAADESDLTFSYDDKARAMGINIFQQTGDPYEALGILPRKFSGEANIIRFLGGKDRQRNFLGAIQSIPRALRLMYVHAYQSLIWNHAASHRWANGGATVLGGDLVLVSEHRDKEARKEQEEEVDADGEPIIRPGPDDRAMTDDERFERARALTAEEVGSGQYTIHDIVIPTPGFDVLYPAHMVKFYEELMAKEEFGKLDPHSMRRDTRDFSLSGHYRKLLAKPMGAHSCRVVAYGQENEQFVQTDVERMEEAKRLARAKANAQKKLEASTSAEDQKEVETVPDLAMSLDGAAESKISAVKKALLGTDAEDQAEIESAAAPTAAPHSMDGSNGTTEAADANEVNAAAPAPISADPDAMDTTTPVEQPAPDEKPATTTTTATKDKLAVILSLQLGSSTYATVALRELAKGGILPYKAEYGGGR